MVKICNLPFPSKTFVQKLIREFCQTKHPSGDYISCYDDNGEECEIEIERTVYEIMNQNHYGMEETEEMIENLMEQGLIVIGKKGSKYFLIKA